MAILPLLIALFIVFSFNLCCCLHVNELELLLSFKSSINDPLHYLSSWSSSSSSYKVCLWNGIVCDDNSSHVITVDLSGKNISGKILSSDIFRLPFVQTINLSNNMLSGPIPHDIFISSSSSLRHLNLSNNNFTGSIPHGYVSDIETLDLSNNILSGEIPTEIGSFSNLRVLDLGGNVLTGGIPISIGKLSRLEFLTLASNQLSGRIPEEIGRLKNLRWIYFGYNNLSGEIPKQIGNLSYSLSHLDLVYNNLTGSLPSSLGNLHGLQYLFLYQNKLSGVVPASIFRLKKLVSLDLSDNSFSGEIPEVVIELKNLEILHLFSNNFTGKIPAGLTSLPRLRVLQLWSNRLSGMIPESLGKRNNLTVLDLSTNNLTGKLPESLCDSGQLFKLIVFANSLEGQIPQSLGACKSLKRVRLQNNRFAGELPQGFTELPLVYFMDLSHNFLQGTIGARRWDMPQLQMLNLGDNNFSGDLPESLGSERLQNLDLSGNEFSGLIPRGFGRLSELMDLNLRENKITGQIPSELSSCKKLVNLDLSHNSLEGEIPSSLSSFPVLGNLDLSLNQLSGEIPKDLGEMESLVQVNISHNLLHGSLPSTPAFLAIDATAVAGNHLCGGDSTSGLPPCKMAGGKHSDGSWFVVSLVLATFLILVIAGFMINLVVKRKRNTSEFVKRLEREDGKWEIRFFDSKFLKSFSIDTLLSSVKEENAVSREKKGGFYKGRSVDNVEFLVKEARNCGLSQEMSEIGKISRHPNILKLLASCRSEKISYLIYEDVEGKRLSEILNGLSWERRRKVIMGIAKALKFLHCWCSPTVLAREFSPERIIVDGKGQPRLSLGFPGLLCMEAKILAHVAPETRETKEITTKSDIYGFGLLLLELLTGKNPADVESSGNGGLVDWTRHCFSECHLKTWIDSTIIQSDHQSSEIVELMNLALHCTSDDPQARPCADNVLETLESIFGITSCTFMFKKIFST